MATLSKMDGRWINEEKPGGLVFFVSGGTAAYTEGHGKALQGSDGHDGLTPERPLSTIDGTYGAVSKAVAGRGDTIVVLPGTVTITAAIGLDKDDLTLTGATNTGSKSRNPSIITSATNTIVSISVDAANVTVENLTLTSTAGTSDVFMINVGATTASPGAAPAGTTRGWSCRKQTRRPVAVSFDGALPARPG